MSSSSPESLDLESGSSSAAALPSLAGVGAPGRFWWKLLAGGPFPEGKAIRAPGS